MTQMTRPARRIARPADPGWKPTPEAELAHLRLCWDRLYQIGYHAESGQWVARYLASGEQMIADSQLPASSHRLAARAGNLHVRHGYTMANLDDIAIRAINAAWWKLAAPFSDRYGPALAAIVQLPRQRIVAS